MPTSSVRHATLNGDNDDKVRNIPFIRISPVSHDRSLTFEKQPPTLQANISNGGNLLEQFMLAGVESIHWVMDSILQIGLYDFMPLWPKTEIGEGVNLLIFSAD